MRIDGLPLEAPAAPLADLLAHVERHEDVGESRSMLSRGRLFRPYLLPLRKAYTLYTCQGAAFQWRLERLQTAKFATCGDFCRWS